MHAPEMAIPSGELGKKKKAITGLIPFAPSRKAVKSLFRFHGSFLETGDGCSILMS